MIKFIIGSLLVGSSIQPIPDADGWVPVERPQRQTQDVGDESKGIWVIFAKELEGERFLVRLPDDPEYRYLEGGIEMEASNETDKLSLRIEKRLGGEIESLFERRKLEIDALPGALLVKSKISPDGQKFDLFYRFGEKWVWERVQSTEKLLYTFQTESPDMSGDSHRYFIHSLDVLH